MKNFLYILFLMVCSLQITAQNGMNMGLVGSYTYQTMNVVIFGDMLILQEMNMHLLG